MESLDFDEPLPKVTCTSTKCEENLHCFRPKRIAPAKLTGGGCHACEAELVNWSLAYARDIGNAQVLFVMMKQELIRHHYWSIPLPESLKRTLLKQGRAAVLKKAAAQLLKSVGPGGQDQFRDGVQTPTDLPNIIFYAQHATATCCRKCIKYWHGIPYDQTLTEEDLLYFQQLVTAYIDERMPNLPELPAGGVQLNFSL